MNSLRFFLLAVLVVLSMSGCHQAVSKPAAIEDGQNNPAYRSDSAADELPAADNRPVSATAGAVMPVPQSGKEPILPQRAENFSADKDIPAPEADAATAPDLYEMPGADSIPLEPVVVLEPQPIPPQPIALIKPDKTVSESVDLPAAGDAAAADGEDLKDPVKENELTPKKIQALLDEALDFCQAAQDFWQKGELENALEALDQAYSLILKIDSPDITPEMIQQKEDLRLIISRRILEIYASRNIVANGKHNAIPLLINKYIQAEINLFTTGREKRFFEDSYRRSGRYRDHIVAELREAGLPEELSWLPLIESGFKVNALSRARALGLWQFIPSTGFKFGLKRDVFIDERLDPEKSTQAAIAYLKELHQIFGDWTTALAAYNCGEGKVLRVIRSQNVNYLDDFWDLFERLPFETARYVPRFLATLHILNNKERYGLDAVTVDPPYEFEVVTVSKQMHLRDIAAALNVDMQELTELNPELRYKMLPRDRYQLRVPTGRSEEMLAKLDEIPVSARPQPAYVNHRVRSGETLSTIAHRYGSSVSRIARANNIYRQNFIVAGKVLKVPLGSGSYQPKAQTFVAEKAPSAHRVRSGDSLWNIAKRYGTTTKDIQELNGLSSTTLNIGQVLQIPGHVAESPPNEDLKTYQVRYGDSPFKISQKFKMPLEQFLRINRLTPRSKIYPGQKLLIE